MKPVTTYKGIPIYVETDMYAVSKGFSFMATIMPGYTIHRKTMHAMKIAITKLLRA